MRRLLTLPLACLAVAADFCARPQGRRRKVADVVLVVYLSAAGL